MILVLPVALLGLLLALGLPVALSLLLSGAAGLGLLGGSDLILGVLGSAPASALGSYELLTIPMFLLMAEFMIASGVASQLFRAIANWTGRVPGGLGIATAVAGAAFGAISGSSTAAAATLSNTSVPAMVEQGYERGFAAGIVSISGTLAMIIPPSIAVIFYGLLSGASIGKLLIAGIVPGALVTLTIILTIWFLILREPGLAPRSAVVPMREKLRSLRVAGPFFSLFGLVTGAIYLGVATPVEASALGALGAMLLALAYGRLSWATLRAAALNTCATSAMIGLIVVCAQVFGYFLTMTGATQGLVDWVGGLDVSRYVVLAFLVVLYLVLGCFLDQLSILILTIPIVLPVVVKLGFDPIWFGMIVILLAEVGMVTPPVGMNVFVVSRTVRMPVGQVFSGVFPHVVAHVVLIVLLIAFPEVILWLPSQMK